jgi:hypothetical protein
MKSRGVRLIVNRVKQQLIHVLEKERLKKKKIIYNKFNLDISNSDFYAILIYTFKNLGSTIKEDTLNTICRFFIDYIQELKLKYYKKNSIIHFIDFANLKGRVANIHDWNSNNSDYFERTTTLLTAIMELPNIYNNILVCMCNNYTFNQTYEHYSLKNNEKTTSIYFNDYEYFNIYGYTVDFQNNNRIIFFDTGAEEVWHELDDISLLYTWKLSLDMLQSSNCIIGNIYTSDHFRNAKSKLKKKSSRKNEGELTQLMIKSGKKVEIKDIYTSFRDYAGGYKIGIYQRGVKKGKLKKGFCYQKGGQIIKVKQ